MQNFGKQLLKRLTAQLSILAITLNGFAAEQTSEIKSPEVMAHFTKEYGKINPKNSDVFKVIKAPTPSAKSSKNYLKWVDGNDSKAVGHYCSFQYKNIPQHLGTNQFFKVVNAEKTMVQAKGKEFLVIKMELVEQVQSSNGPAGEFETPSNPVKMDYVCNVEKEVAQNYTYNLYTIGLFNYLLPYNNEPTSRLGGTNSFASNSTHF